MNTYRLRELAGSESFDPSTISKKAIFTQSDIYRKWQENLDREVRRILIKDETRNVAFLQVVKYPLVAAKSYFYAPYGPVVENPSKNMCEFLKAELLKFAVANDAAFVRLDFHSANTRMFKKAFKTTYHSAYFQPRVEWSLDLNKSEEELLKGMHDNTRYSIRASERRGVTTEIVTSDFNNYFDDFYRLMSTTAARNDFSLHEKKYYEGVFKSLNTQNGYLVIARHENKILVVNLIVVYCGTANYVYSGSSDEDRNLMPSYACLWAAVRHAKSVGAKDFNFGGISSGKFYKGWDGLTTFKKKFGGYEVVHSDFYDVVAQPFWYFLYNLRKSLKSIL